jgi:FkbM family methyltransferase
MFLSVDPSVGEKQTEYDRLHKTGRLKGYADEILVRDMVSPDPFLLSKREKWLLRFHSQQLRCKSSRWTKPFAIVPWAGFMTMLVVSSPGLKGHDVLRAVGRLWLWQIWRRTVKRPLLLKTSGMSYFLVPPWNKIGGMIIAVGLYEAREELFLASYTRPGDVLLDVGANIGWHTVTAAGRGARVYAFEPSTKTRLALEQNVALLGRTSVEIIPAALGAENGHMQFTVGLDVQNHLIDSEYCGTSEPVDVLTLDELTYGATPRIPGTIAFIKIDAEGFDGKVLLGGEETLRRDKPVLIVETWGDEVIRGWLEERGFLVYLYDVDTAKLVEYPKPWRRPVNFIAVHNDVLLEVQNRIAESHIASPGMPSIVWGKQAKRVLLERRSGSLG